MTPLQRIVLLCLAMPLVCAALGTGAAAEGARQKIEDFTVEIPPAWRITRGATSDGTLGHLLEPPTLADGEESFALYLRPFVPASLEALARKLQQEVTESGRPMQPVERLRRFEVSGRPGVRAELTGSDRYSGAPSRMIFWIVPRDGSSVVVLRAVLLDSRFAALAATLEAVARSIRFDYAYSGPGYEDFGDTQVQVIEGDLYGNQGTDDSLYNMDGLGDPAQRAFSEPSGNYCRVGAEGVSEGLQFDGKGQWARHEGAPPAAFSITDLPPDKSGFYRTAGHMLLLEAHTGTVTRCIRRTDELMSCAGDDFDKGACG